jgi:hypothetical protein
MKLEIQHIEHIKLEFAKMQTNVDFLSLLNYVKVVIYGDKTFLFKIENINFYLSLRKQHKSESSIKSKFLLRILADLKLEYNLKTKGYKTFEIKKKSGATRILHAPNNGLKEIQKCINIILQVMFAPHSAATGFVNGKSIVDNATIHCKQNYVYNIDLKDFFPSIEQARFWKRLQYPPFNLKPQLDSNDYVQLVLKKGVEEAEAKKNERLKLANTIASLCFTEIEVERKMQMEYLKK